MKRGELANAKRRALNIFDSWNNITGYVTEHTSYYYELQSIIEDAVECGAQAACGVYEKLECESERDNHTCQYCGMPASHADHIVPVVQGGGDAEENLVAACRSCNLHKGGRTPGEAGMELRE